MSQYENVSGGLQGAWGAGILLQSKAKEENLWNLFLPLESDPDSKFGAGLTNLEYSHLAEIMGWSLFASEVNPASLLNSVT